MEFKNCGFYTVWKVVDFHRFGVRLVCVNGFVVI